jgi:peptide/nickel transport system substrate-binding protein
MRDDHGTTSARSIAAGLGRRDFLRAGAIGTLAAGSAGLLAACGSSSPAASVAQTGGKLKRGGTLQFALGSGGSADALNPLQPGLPTDYARIPQIFEPLAIWDAQLGPVPLLAESIEPNADGSVWTVRLRKGITFHNGKPLTADDVIYTFQQIMNPKDPGYGALAMQMVDVKNLKKVDTYTVQFPCHGPFSMFLKTLPVYEYFIVPVGWKAGQTIGTGPFVLDSFVAGQASTMSRNKNYWQNGLPYVDKVVMTDYTEESARVNALISGQVNCIDQLSAPSIAQLRSSGMQLNISEGGGFCPFTMRIDLAPFSNPDVREALKLCVDRPAIRTAVYGGYGAIGNDVFAYWDADYDRALPQRTQDISKAKFLLKKAGHESLTLSLVVAAQAQGWLSEAELFQQQAAQAGVKINLNQITTSSFNNGYTKWPFANSFWYSNPYLNEVALATLGSASPFNETHFNDSHYQSLYNQAIATLDESKQQELIHEMQTIDYNTSGYIIPAFLPVIDGLSPKVHGDGPSKSGTSFSNWDLRRFWVE